MAGSGTWPADDDKAGQNDGRLFLARVSGRLSTFVAQSRTLSRQPARPP